MNEQSTASKSKKKNPLIDIVVSIVIPSIILTKFSGEDSLGPVNGLLTALSFPTVYFFYEWFNEKKANIISVLGVISVLLTGGVGLLQLDPHWIAVKEAAIPAIIGLVVLISLKTPFPLVKKLIYSDAIIDTEKVGLALKEKDNEAAFETLLTKTSYLLAASFLLSSILNYVLAKMIVVTNPAENAVAFNEEIGKMTALSYPVIVIPSTIVLGFALWNLIRGIKKLTGLSLESVFKAE